VGVIACGRYFPSDQRLTLVVADFGIGIPDNVRAFLKNPTMRDSQTLSWAFTSGTTTRPTANVPRGLGLDLLKSFVRLNGGRLRLWSGRGYALVNREGEQFDDRQPSFPGTLVSISLVCDQKRYILASEAKRTFFSK
jgi:signal transduction histidine kinase